MSSIAVRMGCDVPEGLGQKVNIAATTLDVSASWVKLLAILIDWKLDPTKQLGRLEKSHRYPWGALRHLAEAR